MPHDVQADPWLRRYHHAPGSAVRLVYFPHAGGSATACFRLSAALAPRIEVLAVQYPGRQDRFDDPCAETIDQLAEQVCRALDRVDALERPRAADIMSQCPRGTDIAAGLNAKPTAFFGHSMGAVIAYEVACRIRETPRHAPGVDRAADMSPSPTPASAPYPFQLFVSGRRAPSLSRDERVHLSGDQGLIAELRTLAGTDESVLADEAIMELILPALRADYRAIETYRWTSGPPLACPITAVIGDSDPHVNRAEAAAWQQHTTGGFALHVVPGGHFYLGEGALGVADLLRDALTTRV